MKKRILIIFYALLLCVTASFAWLSNFEANYVNNIRVKYDNGALKVVGNNFDAHIEIRNEKGDFVEIPDGEAFKFDSRKMVPDSITPFKIKIKNNSDAEAMKAKIGVAISVDPEKIKDVNVLDVIYLDVVAGDGFNKVNNYHTFVKLSDAYQVGGADTGDYFLWIYGEGSEIIIPATTAKTEYVTLDCSFYFDQNATAEYQNQSINTLAFRLE